MSRWWKGAIVVGACLPCCAPVLASFLAMASIGAAWIAFGAVGLALAAGVFVYLGIRRYRVRSRRKERMPLPLVEEWSGRAAR